jgi:sterol desaturase/sphingolipid hydroxylase (fatty acid hydroxylase superfamily)
MKNSLIYKTIQYSLFPLVLTIGIAGAIHLMQMGYAIPTVVAINAFFALFVTFMFEKLMPYEESWSHSQKDVRVDFIHNLVSMVGIPRVYKFILYGFIVSLGAKLSDSYSVLSWPSHWHIFYQFVLIAVIGEFGSYWTHRIMHEFPIMWRLHATHHSPHRLYFFNAGRFHPLDTLFGHTVSVSLMVLAGAPVEAMGLQAILTTTHGLFQHANIDVKCGPLNWIFSMTELHRWHHSKTIKEGNTNYGSNLIIWDIIFRTRFLPKDRKPPTEIGLAGMDNFPQSYWKQILSPFQWNKLKKS